MKNVSIITLLLFFSITVNAQKTERTSKNQDEEKDYRAEKRFEDNYEKMNFKRFDGKIVIVNENTIKYNDEVLNLYVGKQFKLIFEKGIFYPEIITGKLKTGQARQEELNSMVIRNDSMSISNLKEIKSSNKSIKVKRFQFWLSLKGRVNPQVCLIELTNNKATKNTNFEDFIKNSILTFYKTGWIII